MFGSLVLKYRHFRCPDLFELASGAFVSTVKMSVIALVKMLWIAMHQFGSWMCIAAFVCNCMYKWYACTVYVCVHCTLCIILTSMNFSASNGIGCNWSLITGSVMWAQLLDLPGPEVCLSVSVNSDGTRQYNNCHGVRPWLSALPVLTRPF